mmetsp:Transcript_2980/g.3879  ORF Transcript_2980/g.3879 Transcript_2980/m.3879 type:complete len:390 (-) Transcript_2980:113-1282(-)
MPKAEVGTPKWISTQWKKKGLNKLRWYCGLCNVSCRDANGFQLHLAHENHLRREIEASERRKVQDTESRYQADAYSEAFERSMLRYLVRYKLGQRVRAHEAYRAVNPDDRPHAIMAQTCWGTLGRFVVDLRDRGEIEAWRDDDGWILCLSQGAPACTWAMVDDDEEARKLHSRLTDGDDGPKDWREAAASNRHIKKRDAVDSAFDQAQRAMKEAKTHYQNDDERSQIKSNAANLTTFTLRPIGQKMQKKLNNISTTSTISDAPPPPPQTSAFWPRVRLVVKAKCPPDFLQGAFVNRKCHVIQVREDNKVLIESLDDTKLCALVDPAHLQTVIPKIGKRVRLLPPRPDAGATATLHALNIDDFSADLIAEDGKTPINSVPYEQICRDLDL